VTRVRETAIIGCRAARPLHIVWPGAEHVNRIQTPASYHHCPWIRGLDGISALASASVYQRNPRWQSRALRNYSGTNRTGEDAHAYIADSAWSRSAIMSSTFSMPTEILTMPSVMPISFLPFSPTPA